MEEKTPPKFRKTKNDKWAVMAPVADLEKALAGDGKIEVLKKSGDWSSFTVASLGKPFDVDGEMMCYGYGPGDDNPQRDSDQSDNAGVDQTSTNDQMQNHQFDQPAADPTEPLPEYQGGAEDEFENWN